MQVIKFTGRFADLPALGFRFQKLHAGNYRCYHNGGIYSEGGLPSFWIWQKRREIEIADWHDLSASVVGFLKGYEYKPYRNSRGTLIDYVVLVCDKETYEVRVRGRDEFEHGGLFMRLFNKEITEKQYDDLLKKWLERYREIVIDPPGLFKVLDRLEGMYEIIEDKGEC
jgi:hypothetical protein